MTNRDKVLLDAMRQMDYDDIVDTYNELRFNSAEARREYEEMLKEKHLLAKERFGIYD